MSWWDTSQLTNFASSALKSAQKKIDKVLDIQEAAGASVPRSSSRSSLSSSRRNTEADFFSDWIEGGESDPSSTKPTASSHSRTISSNDSSSSLLQKGKTKAKTKSVSDVSDVTVSDGVHPDDTSVDVDSGPVAKFSVSGNEGGDEAEIESAPLESESFAHERLSSVTTENDATSVSVSLTSVDSAKENGSQLSGTTKSETIKSSDRIKTRKKSAALKLGTKSKQSRRQADSKLIKKNDEVEKKPISNSDPTPPDQPTVAEQQPTSTDVIESTNTRKLDEVDVPPIPEDEQANVEKDTKETEETIPAAACIHDETSKLESQIAEETLKTDDGVSENTLCDEIVTKSEVTADESKDSSLSEGILCEEEKNETISSGKTTEVSDIPEASPSESRSSTTKGDISEEKVDTLASENDGDNLKNEMTTDKCGINVINTTSVDESGWMVESEIDLDTSMTNSKSESGNQSCDDSTNTLVPNESSSSVEEMLNKSSEIEVEEGHDIEVKEGQKEDVMQESEVTADTVKTEEVECQSPNEQCQKDNGNTGTDMGVSTMSTASSTSSFVKCMIEEAMTESPKHDDADSHSSVSTDHSDMVRIRSGLNSGHTSGDEIDTTTSSDIEIISTPTPNGDYRGDRSIDLSPLRHALSKTMRRGSPPGHTRSDSSSSGQSRPEDFEVTSPDKNYEEEHRKLEANMEGFYPSEENSQNPLQTEKLLKKMGEMAEILEAREKKLMDLSISNADLTETNNILRQQLAQEEKAREMEMHDVNQLTDEFKQRLTDQEARLQCANRERDALKKHLQAIEVDFSKKLDEMEMLLAEKEEENAELLREGEKLSKQQLQSNNIIKKLRAKEKETDSLSKSNKTTIEDQKAEILRLHNVLDSKEEMEKKQSEAITQLNSAVKRQDKEISRLTSEHDDSHEKIRSMQVALDNSYKELAELHKIHASNQSKATNEALSAEIQAKEELRMAMEKQSQQYKQEQESFIVQIEDLQISLSRMEKEHGRREDVYRQEISDLHQRLQEAEDRNEDLSHSVSSATRPLLRQIENLQSTYAAQSVSWEKVEKTMTDRLSEVQEKLSLVTERERSLNERLIELTSKNTSLETQVNTLRQDRARLVSQLDVEKNKVQMLEDSKSNETQQTDRMKNSLQKQIDELKKEKMVLENNVEMEKMNVEAEKKKLILAHETIKEKERQLRDSKAARASSSPGGSLVSSVHSEPSTPVPQEDSIEKAMMATSMMNNLKSSVYDSLRHTGAASMVESLQSQLKQRDGEIQQLSDEISQLEKTRESLSRELVNLTTKNEKLEKEVEEYPEFQEKHKELDGRYQALLQMYGEKLEQMEELQLDLQDIRELYKTQIDQLLKNA